ncbi:carboxypeptidase-like regulatory domain-containing protein [Flagellimonas pelagia]|uniref:Galactose oxidase n=1 Tax=Flagellimonas pelagia TaxID=2306998 RepID=A0A3A1NGX7_9FLAO|nr:carboxypeptidase-like regulatory domain-containing protein [Allomuricauda maritima]RIV44514.1 hypothetical protein D2V05_09130 [Allomuricauda maritima]TXJ94577.1 hypothetical protein FQ017_09045 [Allomuricauda maritima]
MKFIKAITLSILFMGPLSITAQQITGVVADGKTKEPLEGVNIYLDDSSMGTVSKADGTFLLKNGKAGDTIFFRYLGYNTVDYALKTFIGQKRDTVFLFPAEERLGEVEVAGRKKMRDKIIAEKLPPMKYALTGFGSTIVDGKIYVIGGDRSYKEDNFNKEYEKLSELDPTQLSNPAIFSKLFSSHNEAWTAYSDKLQIYDPLSNGWTESKTKFSKRAYHTLAQHNGKIYVMGGKTLATNGAFEYLANTIEVYDIKKDTIMVDEVNPHQASNPLAIEYGDDILLIGGSTKMLKNGKKEYSDKIHFYNVPKGFWYELGKMPKGLEPNGAIVNNKLYIVGKNDESQNGIFQFDLATGKWLKMDEFASSLENPKFTQGNGILYIYQKEILFTFDPKYGELKKYFVNVNLENPNLHFYDGYIYILGGTETREFSTHPSADVYRVDVRDFQYTKPVTVDSL